MKSNILGYNKVYLELMLMSMNSENSKANFLAYYYCHDYNLPCDAVCLI